MKILSSFLILSAESRSGNYENSEPGIMRRQTGLSLSWAQFYEQLMMKTIEEEKENDSLIPADVRCETNKFARGSKIVGGIEAKENSWPWIARLDIDDAYLCGASVINENWVLTAAHCCEDRGVTYSADKFKIHVGDHDSSVWESNERVYTGKTVHKHHKYGNHANGYDFCLIETTEKMSLDGEYRSFTCLPEEKEPVPSSGNKCFVAGWGTLKSGGETPDKLQSVDVEIISDSECAEAYSEFHQESEFCAGTMKGGKDSCQGDSGGPLICVEDNQPVLYGVVSWGSGCADGSPGVYGKVATVMGWMDEKIGGSSTVSTTSITSTTAAPETTEPEVSTEEPEVTTDVTTEGFKECETGPKLYPAKDGVCPDWDRCVLGNADEYAFNLIGKGMVDFKSPDERGSKYSDYASCNSDTHYTGNDARQVRQLMCGCKGSTGCRWLWRDGLERHCIPKTECSADLDDINWGKDASFIGNKIIGKDGIILNARIFFTQGQNGVDEDFSNGWTYFIVTNHQIKCKKEKWTDCIYSPEADLVGVYQEPDCSTTVIQFQSEDFHGHDKDSLYMVDGVKQRWKRDAKTVARFNANNYHQFAIVMHDVEFWQLGNTADLTITKIDEWFNPKTGWLTGHFNDTTYCVGEAMSERPPFGTNIVDKGEAWKDMCYEHSRK